MEYTENKIVQSMVDQNGITRHYQFIKTTTKSTTTQSTQNSHRKNRNSRDTMWTLERTSMLSQLPPPSLSLSTSTSTSASSQLSPPTLSFTVPYSLSLLLKSNFLASRLWQCGAVVTLVVLLFSSIQFTDAITHSTTPAWKSSASTSSTSSLAPTANGGELSQSKYSQPLTSDGIDDDSFRPIIPKDMNLEVISQNVFTKSGQYRVFEPVDSDLRVGLVKTQTEYGTTMDIPPFSPLHIQKFNVETFQTKRKRQETINHEMPTKRKDNSTFVDNSNARTMAEQTGPNSSQYKPKTDGDGDGDQQVLKGMIKDRGHYVSRTKQLQPINLGSLLDNNETKMMATNATTQHELVNDVKDLENLLAEYVDNFFDKGQYQPKPELIIALQQNVTEMRNAYEQEVGAYTIPEEFEKNRPTREVVQKRSDGGFSLNIPRALESGRFLFFTGLKKVMWPIYMGLQILKSLMFALLLPTLIGSFGKLLGKGITSGSAPLFIRPMDEPQDLDFKDNNFNFDDEGNKFTFVDDINTAGGGGGNVKGASYAYNQPEASQTHNQYAYNAATLNQQALSRYGMNERQQLMQDTYLSALQSLGAASFKNSVGLSGSSAGSSGNGGLAGLTSPTRQKPAAPANVNTFQQFQKVPTSSLLLSNYDPFYSPLLSRLDSVFAQLKLNSDNENCREKLICLMYANPAKYAPYSNLVSAQLSRELNELRKPTSDNPDILRFFKYMRAAKDGQDGIDCDKSFDKCKEFKDFENPAMVSTYHDINKLVQARKFR